MMYKRTDRINNLPDDLLIYILSLLKTTEAVQTSFVSKRWRKLWTFLRCVNFDLYEFVLTNKLNRRICLDLNDLETKRKKKHDKYEEFIKMHMTHRHEDPYLNTFCIRYQDGLPSNYCSELVRTLIAYAAKSKPRVFSTLIPFLNADLFAWAFTCESIEEMSLMTCGWIRYEDSVKVPKLVNLPQIRRLHLDKTSFDEESVSILLSGCPVLEDLSLERCHGEFALIFSHKLKCFTIKSCHVKTSWGIISWSLYRATTESNVCENPLKSKTTIEWSDYPFKLLKVSWNNLPCKTILGSTSYLDSTFLRYIDQGDKSDLFTVLSCAQSLEFGTNRREDIFKEELTRFGAFRNLENLSVRLSDWCMDPEKFNPVTWFLLNSPNLNVLTLYFPKQQRELIKKYTYNYHSDQLIKKCTLQEQRTVFNEIAYNHLMWMELSQSKKLKLVEMKFPKNITRAHNFQKAIFQNMNLENVQVIISEFVESAFPQMQTSWGWVQF